MSVFYEATRKAAEKREDQERIFMKTDKLYTTGYAGLQGTYWMIYCVAVSFASPFLLDKGYSNTMIGVILAAANVLAVALQPLTAGAADRNAKRGQTDMLYLLFFLAAASAGCMNLMEGESAGLTILYVLFAAFVITMQPLANAFAFFLGQKGSPVNFGIARGIGSFSYAVMAALLGYLTEWFGSRALNAAGILSIAAAFLVLSAVVFGGNNAVAFRKESKRRETDQKTDGKTEGQKGDFQTAREGDSGKRFFIFLAGTVFLFFSHAFINNFTLQIVENVRGNASDMGMLQAFSAVMELPAMFFFTILDKKIGCRRLLALSAVFFTVKAFLTAVSGSVALLYVSMIFQAAAFAVFIPGSVLYVSRIMPPEKQSRGQAMLTAMITTGNIFASLFGGILIDTFGMKGSLMIGAASAAAGAVLVSVYIFCKSFGIEQNPQL